LLAELGATFIHYLNVQGRYHDHLTLALSAADAAARLGRTVIEGWLRADSIPWAQMEHYGDPVSAQAHLERAQQIAAILKNKDLAALSFAFQARASLFRGDLRQAHFYLSQAQSLSCSPAIQVRIYWVAGEVAASKRQFARAIDYYEDALKTERRSFGDQTVTVHATFLLGEIYTLTREFALAHEYLSNPLCDQGVNRRKLSPAREAYAKLGLARVAINQGDLLAARDHVWEADRLMATQEPTPRLKRLLMRTQTELSTIYTARSN
jgi:tetratricopeptide (TPR) repeat protein